MEKSIFDKIQYMLEAHYPILYLTTFEYDRTRQKVYGILRNLKGEVNVHEWDCVNGLVLCKNDSYTPILIDGDEPMNQKRYLNMRKMSLKIKKIFSY